MRPVLKIAVAGCGPGGLAAALLLARDGHDVTVFERFETPRPIGSGLMIQPTGLAVLGVLGLAQAMKARAARIDRLFGKAATSGRTVLNVRYSAGGTGARFGLGAHRAALFQVLYDAVLAANLPILAGRTVTGSRLADGRRSLVLDGEAAGPFDLVVDALGCNTPLAAPTGRSLAYGALWASLDWPDELTLDRTALEQRYDAASTMAGVMPMTSPDGTKPCAAFFWSLRADRLDAWRAAGLAPWKDQVRRLWPATAPLLDQIVEPEQLTFAAYRHRTVAQPVRPGLVHIGDSWHSASPQLGQGANMALLDAYALSLALRENEDLATALDRHVSLRRGHVRLYQAMTAMFTPVYQSDSRVLPFVRDQLVGPLAGLWPAAQIQAAMVSGAVGSPLRRLGLTAAG